MKSTFVPVINDGNGRGGNTDIFSRLLNDRIILLYTDINNISASLICGQFLALQAEDSSKPIHLYINSPGGSVYDCLAILDIMACIKPSVYTYVLGLAASAGSAIAAAGAKGHRYALPNARIMIHQPSGGFRGQATDIEIQTKEIIYLKNLLTKFMANRSNKEIDHMAQLMERDKFFSAQEAYDIGLIDHVLVGEHDKVAN